MGFRGLADAGCYSQSPIWRWLFYRLREKQEMLPGLAGRRAALQTMRSSGRVILRIGS